VLLLALLLQAASTDPLLFPADIAFEPGSARITTRGNEDLTRIIGDVRTRFGRLALVISCNQNWPRDPSPLGRQRNALVERTLRRAGIRHVLMNETCPASTLLSGEPPTVQLLGLRLYPESPSGPASEYLHFRNNETRLDRGARTQLTRFVGDMRPFRSDLFVVHLCATAGESGTSRQARQRSARRGVIVQRWLRRAGIHNDFQVDPACGYNTYRAPQVMIQVEARDSLPGKL
jgi:hypothetical protein